MDEKITATVLIVEDEIITGKSLEKSLKRFGMKVVGISANFEEGLEKVLETNPDLILMDIKLRGELDGISLSERIRVHTDVPIIFITAHSDFETIVRAKHTNPYGYLTKPWEEKDLYNEIRNALNRYNLKKHKN